VFQYGNRTNDHIKRRKIRTVDFSKFPAFKRTTEMTDFSSVFVFFEVCIDLDNFKCVPARFLGLFLGFDVIRRFISSRCDRPQRAWCGC